MAKYFFMDTIVQPDQIEMEIKVFDRPIIIKAKPQPGGNKVDAIFLKRVSAAGQYQFGPIVVIDIHTPVGTVDILDIPVVRYLQKIMNQHTNMKFAHHAIISTP